jgi:hypothetical protein
MASQKKRLKAQLENAKNKAKNAADKLNYEISINRNKGLEGEELKSGTAYNAADYALKQASNEVRRLQDLYNNYKEPEKAKTETEKVLDTETKRIDDLVKGIVPETPTTTSTTGTNVSVGTAPADRDIAKEIAVAAKFLYDKDDTAKKIFAEKLGKAGYKVSNWRSIEDLTSKYQEALTGNQQRNTILGINQTLDEFLDAKISEQAGVGTGGVSVDINVSSPTQAASTIQTVFKGILNRDATPEEITKLTEVLNKAERKAGTKTRTVNGRTEKISDLDRVQFLTEKVKKIKDPKTGKSEFEVKRGEKESLTAQDLISTARANGITLSQDQINSYVTDVRNGKDVKVLKNQIRNLAGIGMPDSVKKLLAEGTDLDTIYSPYRQTMAAVLEINPETISFTDPVLRSAIGPNGETPLYDFQRALRKDARWQYTNNAREDVFQSVNKVLQDFGFQG